MLLLCLLVTLLLPWILADHAFIHYFLTCLLHTQVFAWQLQPPVSYLDESSVCCNIYFDEQMVNSQTTFLNYYFWSIFTWPLEKSPMMHTATGQLWTQNLGPICPPLSSHSVPLHYSTKPSTSFSLLLQEFPSPSMAVTSVCCLVAIETKSQHLWQTSDPCEGRVPVD